MLQYLEANQIFFCVQHCHPSPRASDFLVFVHVHNGRLGPCDGVMTRLRQRHKGTCAEIQLLHCSAAGRSFCSVRCSWKWPQSDVRRDGSRVAVEEKSTHSSALSTQIWTPRALESGQSDLHTLSNKSVCVHSYTHPLKQWEAHARWPRHDPRYSTASPGSRSLLSCLLCSTSNTQKIKPIRYGCGDGCGYDWLWCCDVSLGMSSVLVTFWVLII